MNDDVHELSHLFLDPCRLDRPLLLLLRRRRRATLGPWDHYAWDRYART